jgi:hypothetical protein
MINKDGNIVLFGEVQTPLSLLAAIKTSLSEIDTAIRASASDTVWMDGGTETVCDRIEGMIETIDDALSVYGRVK